MLFPPLGIPLSWCGRWSYDTQVGTTIVSGLILTTYLLSHPPSFQPIRETLEAFSPSSSAVAAPKPLPPVKTHLTKADFGEKWPFTVNEGKLECVPIASNSSLGSVIFRTDKGIYALNEIAISRALIENYKNLGEIWKDNPEVPGAKMSALPIIQAGSAVCRQEAEQSTSR